MMPPTMAASVPTVAEVKPSEEASDAPMSSSAPPTAAAVPKPPVKPTGNIMPNQIGVSKTGWKKYRPNRINRPHWPRNMTVEYAHILRAPLRMLPPTSMEYGMDANTSAMRMVV